MTQDFSLITLVEKHENEKNLKILKCDPKPITNIFFYEHGEILNLNNSIKLHNAFIENNIINKKNFFLLKDPREDEYWKDVFFYYYYFFLYLFLF
jgi:hypothetical protein